MRAFVDRIEAQIATLLLGDDESVTICLPVTLLPPGAREGAVLQLSLRYDEEATRAAKAAVRTLYDSLEKGS